MTGLLRFNGSVKRDARIDAWLADPTAPLHLIVRPWFERMRKCGLDVRELIADGCPTVCVEDAPFAYVNAFRSHAAVGFFYGALLADPMQLLEGTGKRGRHVKLRPSQAIDEEALSALITAAYEDIRARVALED